MKPMRSIFFGVAVLFLAAAANAQQVRVKADIPFAFNVGNRTYPAGEYILKEASTNGAKIEQISSADGKETFYSVANDVVVNQPASDTKLIFHRAGDTMYLSQMWVEGNVDGLEFPKGHAEKMLAKNHLEPENVIVAANLSR